MPPRKRARGSAASTPLHETQPKTPAANTIEETSNEPSSDKAKDQASEDAMQDPWTVEQETALLKGLVKWPPKGMHKHSRMFSISLSLSSEGYTPRSAPHMRIPGIWNKLNQLYNLDALDKIEDSNNTFLQTDPADPDDAQELPDFEARLLDDDEYRGMVWDRAFHAEQSSSPPHTNFIPHKGSPPPIDFKSSYTPTIKDDEEDESTPAPAKGKGSKGARSSTSAKNTRAGKAAQLRRNQKEQSVVSSSVADEDEEEEEDEDEQEEDDNESTTGKGSVRGKNTRKKQPAPKRTRRR